MIGWAARRQAWKLQPVDAEAFDGLLCSLFKAVECALTKQGKSGEQRRARGGRQLRPRALGYHSDLGRPADDGRSRRRR